MTGLFHRGQPWAERLGLTSLLGRYLYVIALLAAVLVGSAWIAHQHVRATSVVTSANLNERARLQQRLRGMTHELWLLENTLQSFLLAPAREPRRRVGDLAIGLIELGEDFNAQAWVRDDPDTQRQAQQFVGMLRQLRTETARLMAIREQPEQLYPAMPLMVTHMLPAATEFYTQATLAIDEARDNRHQPGQTEVLELFTDARHAQTLLIGAFRLWVANRSGVFGEIEAAMRAQAANIELYSERIEAQLAALGTLHAQGRLELQQADSYPRMRAAHATWRRVYREVLPIYNSDRWRADVPLLRDSVHVLLLGAWESLRGIEQRLDVTSHQDIAAATGLADRLSGSLWLLALVGLIGAGAGVLVLELHIRRPLARVARALKAEAAGERDAPLPQTRITETRGLVEAFAHMREQVHNRQERLQAILDHTAEGIVTFDAQGRIESWNRAAEALFGWSEAEALGTSIARVIAPMAREERPDYVEHFLRGEIQRLVGYEGEVTGQHQNGGTFPLALKISRMQLQGQTKYTALLANISERKTMMERLRKLAEHDGLTDLYNRSYFLTELERALSRIKRGGAPAALLYIDLDNFKYVNDTLGHAAGDRLLTEVAQLLAGRVRGGDLLARLGGDEFTLLAYDVRANTIATVAEGFRQQLADYALRYEGKAVDVGCSIGAALLTASTPSITEALSHADLACHLAKRAGRNRVHVFTADDIKSVGVMALDMGWSRRIKRAIDQDRFRLALQPILDLRQRRIAYHEVLVRLLDDDGSLIMPSGFLPTAERFGLSAAIDGWIVRHAIAQLARERRREPGRCYAINLSAQSLTDPQVAEEIHRALLETQLDPAALVFEVTETAAIADMATASAFLARLRALGCRSALDDFGSGMASFAYLKDLPVDIVKIDGRFVQHVLESPVDQAMVKAMHEVAKALGKVTVAEFVESENHLRWLSAIGIDYAQGFHVGRPQLCAWEDGARRATG